MVESKTYPKDHKHYDDSKKICDFIARIDINKTQNALVIPIGVIDNSKPYPDSEMTDTSKCCSNFSKHYLRFYFRRTTNRKNTFKIEREVMELKIWMKANKPHINLHEYVWRFNNIEDNPRELIEGGVFADTYRLQKNFDEKDYYFYERNADLSINPSIRLYVGSLYDTKREFVIK